MPGKMMRSTLLTHGGCIQSRRRSDPLRLRPVEIVALAFQLQRGGRGEREQRWVKSGGQKMREHG